MRQATYINKVKSTDLPALKELIGKSQEQLRFLLQFSEFSDEDVTLNTTTLMWPVNILPFFDENALMLERSKVCTYSLYLCHFLSLSRARSLSPPSPCVFKTHIHMRA